MKIEFSPNAEKQLEQARKDIAVESQEQVVACALRHLFWMIQKIKEGATLQYAKDHMVHEVEFPELAAVKPLPPAK